MVKRLAVFSVILAVGLLAGGCFGPVVLPTAEFCVCPDGSNGPLAYWFTSQSSTVPNHFLTSYVWRFDDGAVNKDSYGQMSHRFSTPGSHTVSLTITDDRGGSATASKDIVVVEAATVRSFRLVSGWPVRLIGEVENQSGFPLRSVTVQAKFYDADGVRLTEAVTDVSALDPGERVRFSVSVEEYAGEISSASAAIQSFAVDCPCGPYPIPGRDEARR